MSYHRTHLNVVGELDGLVLPVLQHHQLDDRPLPVHRMHRKLHPDRASGRIDAGVRRKFSGSAKPTPEHFGVLRSILKYKGLVIGRMRCAVNCNGNSTPSIIGIYALSWLQKDLLEVFLLERLSFNPLGRSFDSQNKQISQVGFKSAN